MSLFSSLQAGKKERSNTLNIALDNMCKKTRDLRRQVREERDTESETWGLNETVIHCRHIYLFCSFQINLEQEKKNKYILFTFIYSYLKHFCGKHKVEERMCALSDRIMFKFWFCPHRL